MSKKKATAKEPFLPFFVGDFAAATAEWEGEAKSLYLTLLTHQWAIGSIPVEPKRICKLVGWDWELFEDHWRVVRRKFVAVRIENDDGEEVERLINPRLEEHRGKTKELRDRNSESGAKGAAGKWGDRQETDHTATRARRLAEARKKGTHQPFEWAALLTICGPNCLKCSALAPLVKDHITPIYQGGSDAIENLQPLCKKCNCAKGPDTTDYRPSDWRERLAKVIAASGAATHIYGGMSGECLANDAKTSGGDQAKRLADKQKVTGKTSGENSQTPGNPSHPIPSHPDPLPDRSSQDLSGAVPSNQQPEMRRAATPDDDQAVEKDRYLPGAPQRQPTPAGAMAIALRDARVQVTSIDPTLLTWIADGITTEELLEAVAVAKLRKPREVIPANYLDPIVRELRGKATAPPANGKRPKYRTADEIEAEERARGDYDAQH